MTHKHFPATFLKASAVVALVILLVFTGAAAAEKTFFIDTTGLIGKVGETTQVPVKVSGAENLYSIELQVGLVDTEEYTIAFNNDSMQKYFYSAKTGRIAQINVKDENNNPINGTATLFYLEVTPKKVQPVPLTLKSFVTQEGTEDTKIQKVEYTAKGATLNVESGGSMGGSSIATPTTSPTDDAGAGGSCLLYLIAVLGVLAVLIIIIIIVKRRSDNEY